MFRFFVPCNFEGSIVDLFIFANHFSKSISKKIFGIILGNDRFQIMNSRGKPRFDGEILPTPLKLFDFQEVERSGGLATPLTPAYAKLFSRYNVSFRPPGIPSVE